MVTIGNRACDASRLDQAGAIHSQSPITAEGSAVIGIVWHVGYRTTVQKCTQGPLNEKPDAKAGLIANIF
jgi:hypothetical protein